MALAQIYSALSGDIITAARWNNEFGNIYSNGTDVAFPATKAVSFAGFTVTFDASAVSTILSPANTGFLFTIGSKTGTPSASGSLASFTSSTFTDSNTAASGTAALYTGLSVRTPTVQANALSVTTTKAATLYIEAAPIAGTNETITNPYALYVDSGKVQFDGALQVDGALTVGGAATFTGGFTAVSADPYALTNIRLSVVMSGNAVTVAVKTNADTDPTATDVVSLRFRNATLGTSGTTTVNITSALSMAITSGSTLGCVSAQAHRIYVGLLNNAGTAELFVYNPLNGRSIRGLSESALITTTAEGGAGTAGTAQLPYSTIVRSNVAFRIIGFFEATEATAGTWATAASTIQELQPWMPRTGHIVGRSFSSDGVTSGALATIVPLDDTLPQTGEGSSILTATYSMVNAANLIELEAQIAGIYRVTGSGSTTMIASLYTDVSANSITSVTGDITTGADVGYKTMNLKTIVAGLGAMTTATLRAGFTNAGVGANAFYYNNQATTVDLAGSLNTYLELKEIMV